MTEENAKTGKLAVPKFSSFRRKDNPAIHAVSARPASSEAKHSGARSVSPSYGKKQPQVRKESNDIQKLRDGQAGQPEGITSSQRKHLHPREQDAAKIDTIELRTWQPWENDNDRNYVVDRVGDPKNLVYGAADRYGIPQYHRTGNGSILGLNRGQKIDRNTLTNHGIVTSVGRDSAREGKRPLLAGGSKEVAETRLIIPPGNDYEFERGLEYLSLRSGIRKKRHSTGSNSSNSDVEEVDYRSIEGRARHEAIPDDPDLEFVSEKTEPTEAGAAFNSDGTIQETQARLSRRTKSEPRNLQAWLDLIEHQEAMMRHGRQHATLELSNSERRSLSEVKISIYSQALQGIGNHRDSRIHLLLAMMREGAKLWDSKKLLARWRDVLTDLPDSVELWTKYLDIAQGNFIDFAYEKCKSTFRECLEILAKAQDNLTSVQEQQRSRLQSLQIYVLLRLSAFMRDSGYKEHAIALWQAILEYHFFRPKDIRQDHRSTTRENAHKISLSPFQEFWESEVPRIGETGSRGWDQCFAYGGSPPIPTKLEFVRQLQNESHFHCFAEMENHYMEASNLPGRSMDSSDNDDPYHIILFADISEYLELLPAELDYLVAFQSFLGFARLPPLQSRGDTRLHHVWADSFLVAEEKGDHQGRQLTVQYMQTTTETLFSSSFNAAISEMDLSWTRACLDSLAAVLINNDDFCEYYLAFVAHFFPSEARKVAKGLLKRRPSNMRLYNAYAIIESRAGHTDVAGHVFTTALGMAKSLPLDEQLDTILLWRSSIWEAVKADNMSVAWHRALQAGDAHVSQDAAVGSEINSTSPAEYLKAKRTLTEGRDHMLSLSHYNHAVYYTECLALLGYIHSSRDISIALDTFHEFSALLEVRGMLRSATNEIMHQARTQLLEYHVSHVRSFKPAVVRRELSESTSLFPNNTMFLTAYAANESKFRIDDRVRAMARDVVLKGENDTVIGWAFAIWAERKRGLSMGSTSHSVRATYERAVESESGRHSILLWTSYFFFEHNLGEVRRAKAVFLRGLTRLAWVKRYMMLAFTHLREVMDSDELRRVYNVMVEKELRIHVDLDNLIENPDRSSRKS